MKPWDTKNHVGGQGVEGGGGCVGDYITLLIQIQSKKASFIIFSDVSMACCQWRWT